MASKRKETIMETDDQAVAAQEYIVEDAKVVAGDNDPRMTIKQAAEYLGVNTQTFRNTIKNRPEFTAAGVTIRVPIEGSDYSLVKISKSAIDAYASNRGNSDNVRMRDGTRKFILKLTPDQIEAFKAGTLDTTAIELVPASQRAVKPEMATEASEPTEDQGDNDLADASNETEDEDQESLFAGLQSDGYTNSESNDNGQRW